MQVNNYFKVSADAPKLYQFFFFCDEYKESVSAAYQMACSYVASVGGDLSVYRSPPMNGDWYACDVVGNVKARFRDGDPFATWPSGDS
jgi:hypothetical protein